jgi:hypothetical protein
VKPGDTYCNYCDINRLHIYTYVDDYKGRKLFFDTITGEVVLFNQSTIEYVLSKDGNHPKHKVKLFDYIETLPADIFEVVKAECSKKISEKEPEILNLFKCVKNS